MKILSIDCSAGPASCAVSEDGRLLGETFINIKLTHSETLMPAVEALLASLKLSLGDIGGFAISNGPGSFTGIRIGIGAVKGMAAPEKKPCVGVSTLEAIARVAGVKNSVVCALMDARCGQFYNAIFINENGVLRRFCADRAVAGEQIADELANSCFDRYPIIAAGDGAMLFCEKFGGECRIEPAPEQLRWQRAFGVALAAEEAFSAGRTLSPNQLMPVYLRLPQAERELKERNNK